MHSPSRDRGHAHRFGLLRRLLGSTVCGAVLAVLLAPGAGAKSHLWDTLVVFSNAAGNVQFIDMFVSDPQGTGEWDVGGKMLTSSANTYVFPNDLPTGGSTFLTWILIATQDYADLPGAPTPDYIIPPQFFDPAGDEIRYRDTVDIFVISSGAMPTDGIHSLERDGSTPVNVGINFAGESGSVTVPAELPALPMWGVGVALLLMVTFGGVALLGRERTARAD